MTRPGPKRDLAASILSQLNRYAREHGDVAGRVLDRYAIERLLYRISRSRHADAFVLKGANLFTIWSGSPHRPTKDLDLLGAGAPDLDRLRDLFVEVCAVGVEDDGVVLDPGSVAAERIKRDAKYEGVRVHLRGTLGSASLPIQVDVGFGDAITPAPEIEAFPTLLEASGVPRIRAYPRATVVAEKLEAMVSLGLFNSRMKDFFDIMVLSRRFSFDGDELVRAISATFERRETAIPPGLPVALTPEFAIDAAKRAQWAGFARKACGRSVAPELAVVLAELREFLATPLATVRARAPWTATWTGGAWRA